ncbi:RTA1 like protein-domain-containing protein [Clohesyomyces aquaticus]|uniref:RTA1 like protein-domain-containing protein n=1 Tax=Clohesyomyces aquaticus TaxID=1231657 RepID=A0A1Y2A1I4_9PLEO|nr:RTA1 like protein-domain-containing protein [Clohesyomyces aquaticus]
MSSSDAVSFKLWHYTPSIAGGIIGAIVFALLTSLHVFQLLRNRTWFCIPFVIGGIFEAIGYAARAAAHSNTESVTPYVVQSLLILLAPILFAASIYMILGRLILRTKSSSHALIRPHWVTRVFVVGDILCFLMQSAGGGMMAKAKNPDDVDLGEHVILGGLILQILIFGFFIIVALVWHRRLNAHETVEARRGEMPWRRYIKLLYVASVCIMVRNVCRVVEYAMGRNGFLITHEWALYLYDFVLMVATFIICLHWYDPNIKTDSKARSSSDVEIGQFN